MNNDTTPLQYHMYYNAIKHCRDRDQVFLFMVNCKGGFAETYNQIPQPVEPLRELDS